MKKVITAFLILTLLLTLGCGGKTAPENKQNPTTENSVQAPSAVDTAAPENTAAAVTEIESELDGLDNLDDDFLSDELESLDSELDFEI